MGGPPVTLKVGVVDDAGSRTVALHGRLDVESLAAFAGIAAGLSPGARCDLTELKSADDVGVVVLAQLRERGVALVGVSPYLELLLEHAREESG
jgi:ABC-type transporter Mla MlaB component